MRTCLSEMAQESDPKLWCVVSRLSFVSSVTQPPAYPVWFQHYRKENFYDTSLPQGKWTKRESKQNWVQCDLNFFALTY
jgi:hypothetical protein